MNFQEHCQSFIPHLEQRYKVDLSNPKTLNDKLNWLKVYDCTPLKAFCADKTTFRKYLGYKLPKNSYQTIPILKIYNKPSEINFDELPLKCVFKCNHGSGYNIIYEKGVTSEKQVIEQLSRWMVIDYGNEHRQVELHYDLIPKRILVEPYIQLKTDYKFWCFNGEPKFFIVIENIKPRPMDFFGIDVTSTDIKCTPLDITRKGYPRYPDVKLIDYKYIRQMYDQSKIIGEDFKFVRVDFSIEHNPANIYLTELTFIPGSGCIHYTDPNTDLELGSLLKL